MKTSINHQNSLDIAESIEAPSGDKAIVDTIIDLLIDIDCALEYPRDAFSTI